MVPPGAVIDEAGKHLPRHCCVLVQKFEREAGGEQRRHDLPERVHELVRARVAQPGVAVSVIAMIVQDQRCALEIGDEEAGAAIRAWRFVAERQCRRMPLSEIQGAAGPEEMRDDLGPSCDIRQPAERAPGDVDDVECPRLADGLGRIVEIGVHKAGARRQPQLLGKLPGGCDGSG